MLAVDQMNSWIDSPGDLLAILGIAATLFAGLFWIIRSEILSVGKELKPTDGGSLADQVKSIDTRVNTILERQGQIAYGVERLRTENEEVHTLLGHKVDAVAQQLEAHAESPQHDRRKPNVQPEG